MPLYKSLHSNVEDARGWSHYPSKHRNLLNSAGSDVRYGTLGNRKTTFVIGALVGAKLLDFYVRATGHKPNTPAVPSHSLVDVSSFLIARGWQREDIVHILNIHRARPKLDKTESIVMSDSWATKHHNFDKD